MKHLLTMVYMLFLSGFCMAQDIDRNEALMKFLGTSDPEELHEEDVENIGEHFDRKLKVNSASLSALMESGLFTSYQAASLYDYISRHGEILSFSELAAVDGFGEEKTSLLRPFLSLEACLMPGQRKARRDVDNDMAVRGSYKADESGKEDWNVALKYRLSVGQNFSSVIAASKPYGSPYPSVFSFSMRLSTGRAEFLAGDFNARFGQGLALWNGMSLGNVTTPSALMKRHSGLSQAYSYNPVSSLSGVAAGCSAGRWNIRTFVALPGIRDVKKSPENVRLMPAVNVGRYTRAGHVCITHFAQLSGIADRNIRIPDMKSAIDWALCVRGVNLFGETVYDWVNRVCAVTAGTEFGAGENLRIGLDGRYYPPAYSSTYSSALRSSTRCTNEAGAMAAVSFLSDRRISVPGSLADVPGFSASAAVDAVYYPAGRASAESECIQTKVLLNMEAYITGNLSVRMRLSERIRTWGQTFKTDFRLDLVYGSESWRSCVRMNLLKCVGIGLLGYAEAGYRRRSMSFHIRQGIFAVDDWNDRIYVYERDAPGSFNVPAFYGRGLWTSFTASLKVSGILRLYARASYIGYPFMQEKKPGRAELKLQCVLRF